LEFNVPFQHKYGYIRDEQENCALTDRVLSTNDVRIIQLKIHHSQPNIYTLF